MKECPRCNGTGLSVESINIEGDERQQHFVKCHTCLLEGGWSWHQSGCEILWNMRYDGGDCPFCAGAILEESRCVGCAAEFGRTD